MGKLTAFNFITLDGYFEGPDHDISWHKHDAEESEYSAEMLKSGNMLLFGRITYELMASYWLSPMAIQNDPVIAEGMNKADKVVFSRALKKAEWDNTRVIKNNIVEEMKMMKQAEGKDMTILGSGSIITQLAEQGLIDEFQIMINPVVLGNGTPQFKSVKRDLHLRLTASRVFKNGNVLLCYAPLK